MKDKKWTVYAHINKPNNKIYIGITSKNAHARWGKNGNNYNRNPYFWKAIQKYGWDGFEHEIIAEHLTENEAKNFEITLINKLKSNSSKYGYNLTNGGDGVSGYKHTEETKKFLKELLKKRELNNFIYSTQGKPLTEEHKQKISESCKISCKYNGTAKRVLQYSLDGDYIKSWDSIIEASNYLGINFRSIADCCRGEHCRAGNYMWKFDDGLIPTTITPYSKLVHDKHIIQMDLNGNFIRKWYSANDIQEQLHIRRNNISSVCTGKRKSAGGYKWKYA